MNINKARHACRACRHNKRRCDRDLPACRLCSRLGKQCQYAGAVAPTPRTSSPNSPPLHLTTSDEKFPLSYFLDAKAFTPIQRSNALDSTRQLLMEQIAAVLVPKHDRQALCDAYFSSVHQWLPMISKKRLKGNAIMEPEACQDMLLLCMKLCTVTDRPGDWTPTHDPLYLSVRSLSAAAETAGLVSLRLVQSLILITVYEFSHAIYPAAYLTIGRAARLATLMGWHDRTAQQLFSHPETLTHREEQRRTWWAIFILDRFINSDTNGLPFAAPEPHQDEFLPVNDDDWDQGRLVPSEPLYAASFSSVTALGSFARTCQAAHMLGKVISHKKARMDCSQEITTLLPDGRRLHQALSALQLSLEQHGSPTPTDSPPNAALAICITARYLLYNMYGCRDNLSTLSQNVAMETEMQQLSVDGIRALTMVTIPRLLELGSECPLMARCFFETAKLCAWQIREDHDAMTTRDILRRIETELRRLGQRWNVANEFCDLLEQRAILRLSNPFSVAQLTSIGAC